MSDALLLGFGRFMVPIPRLLWHRAIAAAARKAGASLAFMTDDHHRVRDFVVREMPRRGALTPEGIATALGLDLARVVSIVDELEQHLTFLYRSSDHAVTWAYPVTIDETPHHARFSTGEEAYSP